jgi:platelet-activating factor acetylhydrolase
VIAGHSFGAATVIEALREPNAPYCCGIALDAWMFPVARDDNTRPNTIPKPTPAPILAINSQVFTRWSVNYTSLREHLVRWQQQRQQQCPPEEHHRQRFYLLTVRGTGHQNQSDFPVLYRTLFRYIGKLGGRCDPELALTLNTRACLEFLRRTLPTPGSDEHIVDSLCLTQDDSILHADPNVRPAEILFHHLDGQASAEELEFIGNGSS